MENNNKYLEIDERYQNGKIYKVVDSENNLCYIGSTKDPLEERFKSHLSKYKRKLEGSENISNYTVFSIFDKYGIENCKIQLVKLFPCANKYFLEDEEGYEQSLTICVNKNRAGKFRKLGKAEYVKEWYNNNKKHSKQYNADYEMKNSQALKIYRQQYYLKNKERIDKGNKERRLKKKLKKIEIEFEELSK